jgi:hypothetical protein
MAEDQTLEETLTDDTQKVSQETSEETAEVKETPEKTIQPEEVDYRVKFRESQKEAIRLKKENEVLKTKVEKPEVVESETGETLDQIVAKKVEEKIAPLTQKNEEQILDKFLDKNPKSMDYLQEIEDMIPNLEKAGMSFEDALENAYLIASKDVMKNAGKKEMAFTLYQKEQASTSGGGSTSSGAESSLPQLSDEEKKVAQAFGLKEEAYAKNKLKK